MLTFRQISLLSLLSVALMVSVSTMTSAQTALPSPATDSAAAGNGGSASKSDLKSEVDQLLQLVREQQKRIEALEAEHQTGPKDLPEAVVPAPVKAAAVEAPASAPVTAAPAPATAAPVVVASISNPPLASPRPAPEPAQTQSVQAGSTDERVRNLERQIKGLGPISFSGDVRLRSEPFFGGPSDESLDRVRGRVRVRFNAFADLGSQFSTGFTLASGDINDPTTTNQTLTGFYTRKAVALDQAFVQFTPNAFKHLTLIGGKFRYPWYNTELTWDKDLNPEGAAETLGFKLSSPVLKRIALVGFQLPFAEVAGTATTDKRITQQITYGGQLQTQWQLGPHVTLSAFSGYYDYRGADSIAYALARASTKNPQTPLTGLLPLGTGNTVQDSIYTTTATTIVTVGGTAYPTGVTAVSNAQFASKFGLFDNLAKIDIDTGSARFPISFVGDYVQNTEACGNLVNIAPAPANTATTTYKQTLNSPCFSNQRRGYWAEGRVGRLLQKKDIQFGYTRIYIEREAVLGNFNYSDIRQGTNVSQHRFDMFYQFDPNVQLGFTALVGRPLATAEPWLTRLQFDTIYIF
ncbi:MAG TPA: putative porin [Candidatus Sulfotelmatobacter sp.]|nr:putative porin [Candidatus Sulfotelmatobacter sp.]